VASVAQEHGAEGVSLCTIGTRPCDRETLRRRLPSKRPPPVLVSEAGPGGDWLSRSRTPKGPGCGVVAPSLIPTPAGDRVTTTRRDAITLARLRRSADLTPVEVPAVEAAAGRDRCRARAEAIRDLKATQFRRNAVLLRQAVRDTGRATWSPAHLRGRSAVVCPTAAPQIVFPADGPAVTAPLPVGNAWRRHFKSRARPGGSPRWSRPSRSSVVSRSPSR
jgi:transposase